MGEIMMRMGTVGSLVATAILSGLLAAPPVQAAPVDLDTLRGAVLSQAQVSRISGRPSGPTNSPPECGKFRPVSVGECGSYYRTKPHVIVGLIAFPRGAQAADFVRENFERVVAAGFSTVSGDETQFLAVSETQISPGSEATVYGRVGVVAVVAICRFTEVSEGRSCVRKLFQAQVKKLSRHLGATAR
jgi:hypothetical protein